MFIKTLNCVSIVLRSQRGSKHSFLQRKPSSFLLSLDFSYWSCLVVGCWHTVMVVLSVAIKAGAALVISSVMTIFEAIEMHLLWTYSLSLFYWIFQNTYSVTGCILPICGILLMYVEILVSSNWQLFFHCSCYSYRISLDPWSLCIYNFGKLPMLPLTIKSDKYSSILMMVL